MAIIGNIPYFQTDPNCFQDITDDGSSIVSRCPAFLSLGVAILSNSGRVDIQDYPIILGKSLVGLPSNNHLAW